MGNTSITVKVEVFAQRRQEDKVEYVKVTEAIIVYVAIDKDGKPKSLPQRNPDFSHYR